MPKLSVLIGLLFLAISNYAIAKNVCSMQSLCDSIKVDPASPVFYFGANDTSVPKFSVAASPQFQGSFTEFENAKYNTGETADLAFQKTKHLVTAFVRSKKDLFSSALLDKLTDRLASVRLAHSDDSQIQKIAAGACNRPNAIYVKSLNTMLICPGLMQLPFYTLEKILSHEFGHVVQEMQDHIPDFERFQKKQTSEAFADWVASEIIGTELKNAKNLKAARMIAIESQMLFLSVGCFAKTTAKSPTYPSIKDRVEKIFLRQPAFRAALNCDLPNRYAAEVKYSK
ncbi:MAG: hypothetical protein EOP06_13205 [Proteobacteria bacterium]|nr:MAG: hypothetical protein EOP06_13205 [Pseudomonadota bacterium]